MKTLSAILVLTLVAACNLAPQSDIAHDYYGNVYPADCPASIVEDAALLARAPIARAPLGGTVLGETSLWRNGAVSIVIREGVSGWMYLDVARHELCHAKHILDGHPDGGDWHARYVPNVYRAPVCANTFHC